MSPHSNGARRLLALSCPSSSIHRVSGLAGTNRLIITDSTKTKPFVCFSCRQSLTTRQYASITTAPVTDTAEPTTQFSSAPSASPSPQRLYTINAGIVLSRPPILTSPLHPFESAYYFYQRRLNERLVLPFSQYFYFKRGTPSFEEWRAKRRARGGVAARDVGTYNAYTDEAWNDEILMGNKVSEPEDVIKKLLADESREGRSLGEKKELTEEGEVKEKGEDPMAGLRRETEADRKEDTKSLERKLDRTLYLLVRRGEKGLQGEREKRCWGFPSSEVVEKEGVREVRCHMFISSRPYQNTNPVPILGG